MAYMGNKDLRLIDVGIKDGGFENKSMTYWGKKPEAVLVTDHTISNDPRNPSVFPNGGGPIEGKNMLRLPGSVTDSIIEAYHTFIVPEKSKTLSMDRTVETIQYHKDKVCQPLDIYHSRCKIEPDIDYYVIIEDRHGKEITLKKKRIIQR